MVPSILSHYYARERGPFRSLSDLPHEEAESVLEAIRQRGDGFASQRRPDYLVIRRDLEALIRQRFIDKGGRPIRSTPRYMILGQCDWVRDWYLEGCSLTVPLARFDPRVVSFTYGDSFPAMRHNDGKPHRGQVSRRTALARRAVRPPPAPCRNDRPRPVHRSPGLGRRTAWRVAGLASSAWCAGPRAAM